MMWARLMHRLFRWDYALVCEHPNCQDRHWDLKRVRWLNGRWWYHDFHVWHELAQVTHVWLTDGETRVPAP